MKTLIFVLLLLFLMSCESSKKTDPETNAGTTTTTNTTTIESSELSGSFYSEENNTIVYFEKLANNQFKAYYANKTLEKVYTVQGFYSIEDGLFKTNPIADDCGVGIELLDYRIADNYTIFMDGVEFTLTSVIPSQWVFQYYTEECW